jgi:hypothetical protein
MHANEVVGIGAAAAVREDVEDAITSVWRSLPNGFGKARGLNIST